MTDVTGYRQDGGPLGGDGAVAPQVSRILSSKLPLLNTPGSVIENALYYDVNSSSVTAVELQETFGKDKITMNGSLMGSSPTAFIPSVLFANTTYLILQLPDLRYNRVSTVHGDVPPYEYPPNRTCFPHGWGFWAIRDIILYMGASSIAQIQIDCYANFMYAMACCETNGKRQAVLDGAGLFLDDSAAFSPIYGGYPALANGEVDTFSYFRRKRTEFRVPLFEGINLPDAVEDNSRYYPDVNLRYAAVPIRLPFSSVFALEKRLSMDTKLSTQPIQITVALREVSNFAVIPNPATKFYDYAADMTVTQVPPSYNSFESVSLQLWQQELSDKSLSLRNELLAMPDFNVGYPFQYIQSWSTSLAKNLVTTGNEVLCNISSIINSDLTTFFFMLVADVEENGQGQFFAPLRGLKLYDISLMLNGQIYFRFEGDIYETVTAPKQLDYPFPLVFAGMGGYGSDNSQPEQVRLSSTAPLAPSYFYEMNNSKLRAVVNEAHMQNTARFTNQTWQLRFKVDGNDGRTSYGNPVANDYGSFTLHVMYTYNAVFLVGGDGGTTKLVTN